MYKIHFFENNVVARVKGAGGGGERRRRREKSIGNFL
jgi:hypothetical protein